jgi:GNAT superfamily N-acetyltransferase
VQAHRVERGADFAALLDELRLENMNDPRKQGFWHNRSWLADAFRQGKLWTLRAVESDAMFATRAYKVAVFCHGESATCSSYMLPCLCICSGKGATKCASVLWVAERARGQGYGRAMVEKLKIREASSPLEDAMGFWEKVLGGTPAPTGRLARLGLGLGVEAAEPAKKLSWLRNSSNCYGYVPPAEAAEKL